MNKYIRKFIGRIASIVIAMMIIISSITPSYAKLFFTNDIFWNEAEIFRIGQGDSAALTDLSLQFGSTGTETLGWDFTNTWFEVSDDFSLEGNEIKNVLLDNQTSAPGSPVAGEIYHNTTDNNTYVHNGSTWEDVAATFDTSIPTVQAGRSTTLDLALATTWYDISLNDLSMEVETDSTVLEHNNTNDDQIEIYEDGYYKISYRITTTDNSNHSTSIRVKLNEVESDGIHGSEATNSSFGASEYYVLTATFIAQLSNTDHITLQAYGSDAGNDVINETVLLIQKLEAVQGEDGPSSASSTGTTSNSFIIDNNDSATDVTLQFGTTLAESLMWDNSDTEFDFSDDLTVDGNIEQNGTIFTLDADNAGSGATTTIISEQGSESNGGLQYNATTNQWEISNDGGTYAAINTGSGSASTLDSSYDHGSSGGGRSIDADSGAVELTVSNTDNNAVMILNQNDTSNNPNTLEITNTGTGYAILGDSGDTVFDQNVTVGGNTSRTETITDAGFDIDGDELFVAGTAGIGGSVYTDSSFNFGDGTLTMTNGYIRETGNLVFQPGGDSDDYIFFNTDTNQEYIYFEDAALAYANDPGIRLNSTSGELEYRDENESGWTTLDSLSAGGGGGESWDDLYNNGHVIAVDDGPIDLNGTGELIELGNGTAADSYITFDDGEDRQLGWDDSEGMFSTFGQQLSFRTLQGTTAPVVCGASYAGMQWMDTDTGIVYICDTSNSRNKWLSVHEKALWGEESGTCPNGSQVNNNTYCEVNWGNSMGGDVDTSAPNLGLYIPHNITITGYGFSADDDNCTTSLDVEVWSTASGAVDESYSLAATIATLSGETGASKSLNFDITGDRYITWGIDNNCGGGIDDYNIVLYYRYRP